jgi:hypothetical protein
MWEKNVLAVNLLLVSVVDIILFTNNVTLFYVTACPLDVEPECQKNVPPTRKTADLDLRLVKLADVSFANLLFNLQF